MIDLICDANGEEGYVLDLTPWYWDRGAWRRSRKCSVCLQWHEEVEQEQVRHV